jgi:hemolysin activation/secretion protein
LERWLLLAQDVPGITLRTVLRPSAGDPGALSLVAQVSRKSVSGILTADNRGYKGTGPEQILASLSANSFTEYGEHTDATFFYTARYTELFGQISTELFLGASGLKVRLYAGKGTNDPSGSLGQLGYHGETAIAGMSLSYPLVRRRQETLNLAAFFDALRSHVDTASSGIKTLASHDNLRVVRFGADYALRDVLLGSDQSAVTNINLRVSKGLTALGASPQGEKLAGRVGERIGFTKVGLEISRTQVLFSPFEDATVALQVLAAGQYSGDVLPSAEKFYLGGLRLNRGFYSGEVTGDRAGSLAIEPQLNTSFVTPDVLGGLEVGTQGYLFYDWGETWESQKSDHNARIESAGVGVRLFFPENIEFDIEAVNRLTRKPQGASSNVAALQHSAIYWRLVGRF